MASVNVQFREDAVTVEYLRSKGLAANQIAKEAFEREVRRLRAEDHARELTRLGVKLPAGLAERAVREARDAR